MPQSTAAEIRHLLGPIPAFLLLLALTPVFLLLALLYVCSHPRRKVAAREEMAVGDPITT